VIEAAEVNETGSVPELKVINRSPEMVLLLDGEELVGAKQNRIVNITILSAKVWWAEGLAVIRAACRGIKVRRNEKICQTYERISDRLIR
jgi:hypothetical protein